MLEKEAMLKRTQLKRSDYTTVGNKRKQITNEPEQIIGGMVEQYSEEIFDDSDFYSSILTQIINDGATEIMATTTDTDQIILANRGRNKKRKKYDHRASKERKIKYVIMPKLANFMAPATNTDEDFIAAELYQGLFGGQAGK